MTSNHTFLSILKIAGAFLLAWGVSFYGCGHHSSEPPSSSSDTANAVLWKDTTEAQYARGFRISYYRKFKLLEIINPFQNKMDTLRYVLKPRNIKPDTTIPGAQTIEIPIRTMVVTSTTHLGPLEMLHATPVLRGIAGAKYAYDEKVRRRIKSGKISAYPPGELNKEKMLALAPDVIMVSGGDASQYNDYQLLTDSGIKVLINADWLETTPLGKAEWVKVMAALLNKETEANSRFAEIADRYNSLKSRMDSLSKKPLVINSVPYKGAWFVSGGNSYMATYLKDAGAAYAWSDNASTGSISLAFESVYEVGLRADVWMDPGAANSKEALLANDARFKDFKAFKTGRIYNNNRRMSRAGGNDFWESGVVHPDVVLADLIHIFHPRVMPNHTLYYFKKLK